MVTATYSRISDNDAAAVVGGTIVNAKRGVDANDRRGSTRAPDCRSKLVDKSCVPYHMPMSVRNHHLKHKRTTAGRAVDRVLACALLELTLD
jgi:hypothetical protein